MYAGTLTFALSSHHPCFMAALIVLSGLSGNEPGSLLYNAPLLNMCVCASTENKIEAIVIKKRQHRDVVI